MTEKEFKRKQTRIRIRNKNIAMKQKLHQMKKSRFPKFTKPSTSKIVLFIVFAICVQILCFSEYMAITTGDTSYMYVLIGVPCALIPTILGYFNKSKCENQRGGIVYDMAMSQQTGDSSISDDEQTDSDEAVG